MGKITEFLVKYQDERLMEREGVELVRRRIRILRGIDKGLMSLYYIDGCSYGKIAAILGINESNVSRRIRKITSRLISGQYIRCLQNKRFFSPQELQIAREYYISRRTMRQIAEKSGSSFYEVRKSINRIEAILDAAEKKRTYKDS